MPHQLSVFAENKPGKIEKVTGILAQYNINIRAITISDAGDYGIIKLLVDKPVEANEALNQNKIAATLKDIVAVKINDNPGSLNSVASALSKNNINVEDAYGFIFKESNAAFIFQVDNIQKTESILLQAGFEIIDDKGLYFL